MDKSSLPRDSTSESTSADVLGTRRFTHLPPWLLTGVLILLGAIAIANAIGRLVLIASGDTFEGLPADREAIWLEYPALGALHLVPGILFMLLGPLQFSAEIRGRWPTVHRASGRIYVLSAIAVGTSSVALACVFPNRGFLMDSSSLVFGTALVACVVLAVTAIRRREIRKHRAWMIRGYSIGMAVATQRVVLLLFQSLVGGVLGYAGAIVWGVWILHVLVAEMIVRRS